MIGIIDCDSIIYSSVFGIKLLDEYHQPIKVDGKFTYRDKTEEEVRQSVDFFMESIIKNTKCTHIIGFIKGKETIKDRKDINPDYKSNRTSEIPIHYQVAKDHLINRWKVYEVHGMEVDDAVNIVRTFLPDCFIVGIDRDLLELESINPHFNWRKNEWITITKEQAIRAFWKDMICGQQGDGLSGLKGCGEKYFIRNVELLTTFSQYPEKVLGCYIEKLGEEKGIEEFYKNYKCLKILDKKEGFEIPKPIDINQLIKVDTFNVISDDEVPEFDF